MKTYYQIETNAQYNSVIMKVLNSISLRCAHLKSRLEKLQKPD